ncbi:MAG: ImmA/IrrE family metallo-endopeptidase [Methylobacter sp.]
MTTFKLTHDWTAAGHDNPEIFQTMANLALHIGDINLMQNEDIWAKTIRDSVLVSAYPLAMWLASSWWRLNFEPLPAHGVTPSIDWRMAHEMGAANHGFVWPKALFASDCEVMQIWAVPSSTNTQQSVRYLNGLDIPASIKLADFQLNVEKFITLVLNRLDAVGCRNTDLWNLWQLILEERSDPRSLNYRRLEAELGYDPDECPEAMMGKAQELEQRMGAAALTELAPVYGRVAGDSPLNAIEELIEGPGLTGTPNMPSLQKAKSTRGVPWQRAVAVARELRESLSKLDSVIDNKQLYDLLGLSASSVEDWTPAARNNAAIGIPDNNKQFKFVPRKTHPLAKRFEFARLLGDYILTGATDGQWLTSTDLSTSRQKYQRAFAAEFLCPINALQDFLRGDYSESAIEDATEHFQVSQATVSNLLRNNGLIFSPFMGDYAEARLPYQLGV